MKRIKSKNIITPNGIFDGYIYFEDGKTKNADYLLKENNLSLKIAIRTNKILLSNQYIRINYSVIDSNNDYDYYIEMSEQI